MDHGPTEQFATAAPAAPAQAAPAKRKRPVPEDVLEELPANALEQTRPAKRVRKPSKKTTPILVTKDLWGTCVRRIT